jgi:hypothetical protein
MNALVDNERMRSPATTYIKIAPTNHWRRVGDAWGRDWIARNAATGELRRVTYRDEVPA